MSTQILMPALSPTMTEGKLARWLKKVGEDVRAGDVIAEIETDKATMEVEAVDEGKLSQILIEEGTDGVAVNTPIAVLNGDGQAAAPAPALRSRVYQTCDSPPIFACEACAAVGPRRRGRARHRDGAPGPTRSVDPLRPGRNHAAGSHTLIFHDVFSKRFFGFSRWPFRCRLGDLNASDRVAAPWV